MAEKKTKSSCYQSKYSGGWITVAAMLAEMSCERIAGNQTLGARFWQTDKWKSIFIREMTLARRLLADFDVKAIVLAWNSRQAKKVQHLGVPYFRPIVETEQLKLNEQAKCLESAPIPETIDTLQKPRPTKKVGKSVREKLLDYGEEGS